MSRYQPQPFPTRRCRQGLLVLLCLALAGCGFQLRGTQSVPEAIQPVSLTCQSGVASNLCNSLRRQLDGFGLLASEEQKEEAYRLTLSDYRHDRRVSAITGRAAAAEYELTTQVRLSLFTPDNIPLLAETNLQAIQAYRSDETRVLAEEGERGGIQNQLNEQLAMQVIARLRPFDQTRIDAIRGAYEKPREDSAPPQQDQGNDTGDSEMAP
ncbi:MAG: hypothetical protein EA349_11825 [Halomonadaceae bacterium]|nr:MAG: hypothetical protein EA349_11825 [Halomonadaceae bacterium]